ncbi:MAG: hypothetical protein ACLUSP_02095 [Christensenellales bacterium]
MTSSRAESVEKEEVEERKTAATSEDESKLKRVSVIVGKLVDVEKNSPISRLRSTNNRIRSLTTKRSSRLTSVMPKNALPNSDATSVCLRLPGTGNLKKSLPN